MKIKIEIRNFTFTARLYNTGTSKKIYESLPLAGNVNIWGAEIYFTIPLTIDEEPDAKEYVGVGELGYWPLGPAFCIFFGPTPVSTDERPKAYSPVNVFGKIEGDLSNLNKIEYGEKIIISKIS